MLIIYIYIYILLFKGFPLFGPNFCVFQNTPTAYVKVGAKLEDNKVKIYL